jgi:hypothetical protein
VSCGRQHINDDKLESAFILGLLVGAHCLPSTGSVSVSSLKIGAIIVASERRWVMSQKLAVVVTGGTGKQGGAMVKSLLERGHEVRAVTRSTDSAKARELANADVRASLGRHGRARESA